MICGYARVSTDGQSVHAQVKQLRAAGAEKVWREIASGAKSDRVQLRRLLDQLAIGGNEPAAPYPGALRCLYAVHEVGVREYVHEGVRVLLFKLHMIYEGLEALCCRGLLDLHIL